MIYSQNSRNQSSVIDNIHISISSESEDAARNRHYDWGLRAVKSVLVVAGHLKRAEPGLPEEQLLMRALRDFNIPKIVRQDEVVFFGAHATLVVLFCRKLILHRSIERLVPGSRSA